MELKFDKDVEIDKLGLDIECIDQPRRFKRWSDAAADARRERTKAKQRLKVMKAEAMLEIRSDPNDVRRLTSEGKVVRCKLDKVTDPIVTAMVEAHPDVVNHVVLLADAEHNVEILEGAKESFQDRKKELENLVHLYLSGYWAQPKLPQEETGKLSEKGSEAQEASLQKGMREKVFPQLKRR